MIEQQKKRKRKVLLIRTLNPLEADIGDNLSNFEKKIIRIFKYHIGKDNAISQTDLFEKITGKDPVLLDVFERAYLWNVIRAALAKLRTSEVLFVVNNSYNYYVLQTMDEYKIYEKKCDGLIQGLKDIKGKALKWVQRKRYLKVLDY